MDRRCDCELRDRQWDPDTGCCRFCKRRYYHRHKVAVLRYVPDEYLTLCYTGDEMVSKDFLRDIHKPFEDAMERGLPLRVGDTLDLVLGFMKDLANPMNPLERPVFWRGRKLTEPRMVPIDVPVLKGSFEFGPVGPAPPFDPPPVVPPMPINEALTLIREAGYEIQGNVEVFVEGSDERILVCQTCGKLPSMMCEPMYLDGVAYCHDHYHQELDRRR